MGSIAIIILIFLVILFRTKPPETIEEKIIFAQIVPITVEVTDLKIIGINVENDSLKFGTVMKGNFAERGATIVNPFNDYVRVLINISENVNTFMNVSSQDFMLNAQERKKVMVHAQPSSDTKLGNYTGSMSVTFINQTQ